MLRFIGRILKILVLCFALIGLLVVGGAVGLGYYTARHFPQAMEVEMPEAAVLHLNLGAGLPERAARVAFGPQGEPTLRQTVAAIEAAAKDTRIRALVADINSLSVDFARAQAIRRAIKAFRASGKPAYAYSESLGGMASGTLETYVAAAFTEVWLLPTGEVAFNGIGVEQPFLADFLNRHQIDARFEERLEYKGGADMFLRSDMNPAVRANLQSLLQDWVDQVIDGVAQDRGLDAAALRGVMDRGVLSASEAVSAGLADKLYYDDEMYNRVDGETGHVDWLSLSEYRDLALGDEEPDEPAARVAVITGAGAIFPDGGADDPFAAEEGFAPYAVADALSDALEDEDIDAVVLRIDSPGGDYLSSDIVRRAVTRFHAAGKPIVASFGDYAASGGYFVGMAADAIVAEPGSLVGSIGVYGGKVAVNRFLADWGVHFDGVSIGEKALMFSPMRDFTESERRLFAASIDRTYADFRGKAKADRNLDDAAIDAAAGGRVFTGRQAQAMGLVDRLGGLETALDEVRARLNLAADAELALVDLPERQDWWQELAAFLGVGEDLLPHLMSGEGAALSLSRQGRLAQIAAQEMGLPKGWIMALLQGGNPALLSPPLRITH